MSEPVLLAEKRDHIAIVTFNRPEKLNALSFELRSLFEEAMNDIRDDENIRVVILTGNGRAFSAGRDLKEMADPVLAAREKELTDPPSLIRSLPQPVIVAINGLAITGGLEIAVSCDIVLATPETQFGDTHARVGIVPGWGLSQRLSRIVGPLRAKEISLTGNFISAELAYDWGLVNRIVPGDELMSTAMSMAEDMASCVPEAMFMHKRMIDGGLDLPLGEAMAFEQEMSRKHQMPSTETIAGRFDSVRSRGKRQTKSAS